MTQADTNDDERGLLAKIAGNIGATVTANDDERALLVAILQTLTA